MECYFCSNPSRMGYRKRMLELWNIKGLFFITKWRLVDQANSIRKRGWLAEIELEETERKMELNNGNRNDTDLDNVTPKETNNTTMSEEESFIEQVDQIPKKQNAQYTIKEPFNEEEEKLFKTLVNLMDSIKRN